MRRTKLDCFRMCFRVKVVDALPYVKGTNGERSPFERQTVISFINTTKSMYDGIQEGFRYRFYNVKPECFYRDSFRIKPQS